MAAVIGQAIVLRRRRCIGRVIIRGHGLAIRRATGQVIVQQAAPVINLETGLTTIRRAVQATGIKPAMGNPMQTPRFMRSFYAQQ